MPSQSVDEAVESLLATSRGLVVAAAGCGKTELIARTVADARSGRQLVLTHTHAGVAALKRRLEKLKVPPNRYHLDTIAGWSLKYAAAYAGISRLAVTNSANPAWDAVYPAARRVLTSKLGNTIVSASYDGVLVDEYQDCSVAQHAIVERVADVVPVRVVGDPLQAIFGFRKDDPTVDWPSVERFFERQPDLATPHRWEKVNPELGAWLIAARTQLLAGRPVTIESAAPVEWAAWSRDDEVETCLAWKGGRSERVAAIKKSPMPNAYVATSCFAVASRLGGRFQMVEAFDDRDLPAMAEAWKHAKGGDVVKLLHEFVKHRMIKVGPELHPMVAALADGRPTTAFRKHPTHRQRLEALARDRTPEAALAALDGFRGERGWTTYRPEGLYQLRVALQECEGLGLDQVADAVAVVRTRVRHRGRLVPWRTLGTTLLLKGLEFDDAIVLNADELTHNELYVAMTRGARSLRVLSASRVVPKRGAS